MKFFIVFFLLFSISHGYSQSFESESGYSEGELSEKTLKLLQNRLNQHVNFLISVFLDKDTPRENQIEILNELETIADVNGQITIALNQISQSGLGQNEVNITKDSGRDEDISVWAKNQVELIRRKQSALNELQRREEELDKDFM